MSVITLYHGSKDIITTPDYNFNNPNNDFGRGFYCTEDLDLAKEWAVEADHDGNANKYFLELDGLKILDLLDSKYSVLHWITLLAAYRKRENNESEDKNISRKDMMPDREFDEATKKTIKDNREWLMANCLLPIDDFDIIKGFRADDNYFLIAEDFLRNFLTLEGLKSALRLGDWGEQIVLKSEKAFSRIRFAGSELAPYKEFYVRRESRNAEAFNSYERIIEEYVNVYHDNEIRLNQIIAGKISLDDPRLWIN